MATAGDSAHRALAREASAIAQLRTLVVQRMKEPSPTRWILPFAAAATLTAVVLTVLAGAHGSAPPAAAQPRPTVSAPRMPAPSAVAPVSDVRWDAAAKREADELPAVPVGPGEEFHVTSEIPDDAVVAAVLAASRRAIPLTLELLGKNPRPQRRAYEVRVLRTRERVAEEAHRIGWTPPRDTVGFADLVGGCICLTSDDLGGAADVLALAGPGAELTSTAAHEAAHLVAGRCLPGAGGAEWLCAEYVAEQVLEETYPGTELGAIPCMSQQMQTCKRLLEAGSLPSAADVFAGRLERLDDDARYAVHWAFFRYLNDPAQRDRTHTLIGRVRELPWSDAVAAQIAGLTQEVWGAGGLAELTAGFHAHVRALAPLWSCTVGRFEVSGTTWMQMGDDGKSSYATREDPAGRANYRIRGALEILPRGDKVADVQFGGSDAERIYVAFEADQGVGLWVLDGSRTADRGPPVVFTRATKPAAGRRMEFSIEVTSDRVAVYLDGAHALSWDTGGRDLTGGWGVDCVNFARSRNRQSSAAIWYRVRLE